MVGSLAVVVSRALLLQAQSIQAVTTCAHTEVVRAGSATTMSARPLRCGLLCVQRLTMALAA